MREKRGVKRPKTCYVIEKAMDKFKKSKKPERTIFRFLKNKAGDLLKTKENLEKQTENKAETNLSNLLKTKNQPENQGGNKPENKAGHVVENKWPSKNKPKTNRKRIYDAYALQDFPFQATSMTISPDSEGR